jgi:ribosomal protein S18 acetylase RimI-like enzyme
MTTGKWKMECANPPDRFCTPTYVDYRRLEPQDIARLIPVMTATRGSIARATAPGILRAFCRDACQRRRPPCLVIVIAEETPDLAGYVVAEIGGEEYWRAFARRHPLAAARILWKRARKRFHRAAQPVVQPAALPVESPPDRGWQDSGRHIARVQQIAVHPDYRGRGVAARLYAELFAALRPLGIARADANIDADNEASVALHRRTGWTVVARGTHYFATIDL